MTRPNRDNAASEVTQNAAMPRLRWTEQLTRHVPPDQFGRYLLVGIWNTAFGYGSFALLTALLTPLLSHGYIVASIIASLLNISVSYLGYKWFVFKSRGNYLREWARCVAVYSGAIIAGTALLPVLVLLIRRGAGLHAAAPYIAGAIVTVLNVIYSFLGHKKFTFGPSS